MHARSNTHTSCLPSTPGSCNPRATDLAARQPHRATNVDVTTQGLPYTPQASSALYNTGVALPLQTIGMKTCGYHRDEDAQCATRTHLDRQEQCGGWEDVRVDAVSAFARSSDNQKERPVSRQGR